MNAERRFSWGAGVGVALLLAMACPASASAGNIFMKNGYIIQGRIVDRDATSVILGWPNGKVAIARRFVESVEYEHAEEERIRQLEQARQEKPDEADSFQPTALAESTDEGELPASLEMFIQKYQLEPLKHVGVDLEDPLDATSITATDPVDMGTEDPVSGGDSFGGAGTVDLVPDVNRVPGESLAQESVESDTTLLALRPPKSWKQQTREGFLAFSAAEGDGVKPSMNVVSMDRGSLSAEDFIELLREQQEENLVAFDRLSEGATMVGEQRAYEIQGRCSYENRPALVRQIVVVIEDRVWLFSAFVPEDSDAMVSDSMALVDAMLDTVEFRTDAPRAPEVRAGVEDSVDGLDVRDDAGLDDAGLDDDVDLDDAGLDDADLDDADRDDAGLDDADLDDAGLDDADLDDAGLDDAGLDDAGLDDVGLDDAGLDDVDLDDVDLDVDLDSVDVDLDDLDMGLDDDK